MQISQVKTAIKALWQLGFTQVSLNALYKLGLTSDHYQRSIQPPKLIEKIYINFILPMPSADLVRLTLGEEGLRKLQIEADEIVSGKFRQFGSEPVVIQLIPGEHLPHWTDCEKSHSQYAWTRDDIKFTWEPARFGWAIILGRAYYLTQDERYAVAFWKRFGEFTHGNPAYFGPNWSSGQEVGLRLMAWIWCAQVFGKSETSVRQPDLLSDLANQIAIHAARIPGTLLYARSQNNNHLLTEAAALYSAAMALPDHPLAQGWRKSGEQWLGWCFTRQIDSQGEYVQHSMNYHRLMLQTALWVKAIHTQNQAGGKFPGGKPALDKLSLATRWLLAQIDPVSGQAPNLGANDGALILPLSTNVFTDYRPLAQAAGIAFLSQEIGHGSWDEMALWFGLPITGLASYSIAPFRGVLHGSNISWASLRAAEYSSRPSHADQLHFELWWKGENICRDAGTYRYNSDPPWDNQLTSSLVHNTVCVNDTEQMTRAGRFLYLDWANASFLQQKPLNKLTTAQGITQRMSARTNAYARLGVRHTREVSLVSALEGSGGIPAEHWLVQDDLTINKLSSFFRRPDLISPRLYRLHWLLPDWDWEIKEDTHSSELRLKSPYGWMQLSINATQPILRSGLYRAGTLIHGMALVSPLLGWFSPTYNLKTAALSLTIEVQSVHNLRFISKFSFPIS